MLIGLIPCKYSNPCGVGAVCRNVNAKPVCECPSGKTGDPYEVCVGLPMSCGLVVSQWFLFQ